MTERPLRRLGFVTVGLFDPADPRPGHGPRCAWPRPDLVGPSDELAERLRAHAGFRRVDEVAFALPFTFAPADYEQIPTDLATRLGPALGWTPAA